MDALPGMEMKSLLTYLDGLVARTDEMHFDPAFTRIVNGFMAEGTFIDVAAKLAIDARQQVDVERGCDAR